MPLFSEKGGATILEPLPFADWQQRPAWPAVSLANTDRSRSWRRMSGGCG